MNLFAVINRGIAHSGSDGLTMRRLQAKERRLIDARHDAIAQARELWANALLVDETRAWLEIEARSPEVLSGLTSVLTLAALAKSHDDGDQDSREVRVIRGAISAAEQCGKADAVITAEYARSIRVATREAADIVKTCTDAAIEHAARYLSNYVNNWEQGNAASPSVV